MKCHQHQPRHQTHFPVESTQIDLNKNRKISKSKERTLLELVFGINRPITISKQSTYQRIAIISQRKPIDYDLWFYFLFFKFFFLGIFNICVCIKPQNVLYLFILLFSFSFISYLNLKYLKSVSKVTMIMDMEGFCSFVLRSSQ